MAGRLKRTAALLLAVVTLATGAAISTPRPAEAGINVPVLYGRGPNLTWLDGDGAQYVVTSVMTDIAGPSGTFDLVIGRTKPDGTPDAAWGSYSGGYYGGTSVGVRTLDLDPPAADLTRTAMGVGEDGVLNVTWVPASCQTWATACDTWFSRHDATGAQVSDPVLLEDNDDHPVASLIDGSYWTTGVDGATGWRSPTGVDLGFPDLGDETLAAADVDASGRLLVVTSGQRVLRWPAGGPVDLEVDVTGCPAGARVVIGRSTVDDSFATACTSSGSPIVVQRHDATGAVAWTATAPATAPQGAMAGIFQVLVDEDEQVWLAGKGTHPVMPYPVTSYLQAFTADTRSAAVDWRVAAVSSFREYGSQGYTQLREAPGDQIAYVEEVNCCQHPAGGGTSAASRVRASIVAPKPVQAPTCTIEQAALTAVTRTSAHLHFAGCTRSYSDIVGRPTGYRVEVRSGDLAPAITEHPNLEELEPFDLDVALQPGARTEVTIVPVNEGGDGAPASIRRLTTVAPFATTAAFVDRQVHDVLGSTTPEIRSEAITSVDDGTTEPAELVDGWLDRDTTAAAKDVRPVARLYEAFFLRGPDSSGLTYWLNKRRSGQKLAQTADQFARSPEFTRRYGTLSNRAFVAQLYRNAFGREADAPGLAHWTTKLDQGRLSRGGVVAQFSESSEYRRRSARHTEPAAAAFVLLGRVPTASERATWAAAPDPQRAAVTAILASVAYAGSVADA